MEQVVLNVIRGIVTEVNWRGKGHLFTGSPGVTYATDVLMGTLIYAMATGVDNPSDFDTAAVEDLNFQSLGNGRPLDWQTLHEFHIFLQPAVELCLAKLFERTVLVRFGDDFDESILADSCVAQAWDCWFESLHVPARSCWQHQFRPAACVGA